MSNRTPRGTYPGTRKFQRLHLRRFDLGTAANDGRSARERAPQRQGRFRPPATLTRD